MVQKIYIKLSIVTSSRFRFFDCEGDVIVSFLIFFMGLTAREACFFGAVFGLLKLGVTFGSSDLLGMLASTL
jgi:hypothetical protein